MRSAETKLKEQAACVVWRDGVVTPGQPKKNYPKKERILPDADPGYRIAHQWRKRLSAREIEGRNASAEINHTGISVT